MAVAFVAASEWVSREEGSSTTTRAIGRRPTGTSAGDVMVAFLETSQNTTMSSVPTGWSLIGAIGGAPGLCAYWKVAEASDPSSWLWQFSSPADTGVIVLTYSGVDTASPIDDSAGNAGTGTMTLSGARITSTGPGMMAVSWAQQQSGTVTLSVSAPWTKRMDTLNARTGYTPSVVSLAADYSKSTSGQSLLPSATSNTTGRYSSFTVMLREGNNAPNAPTLTGPANNATIDRGIVQRFAWTFSDPDAGDSQSKFDLQYRTVGESPWTTVTGTTPNTFYDFAAGTFAAGNYEWQVRTYDSQGVVGPWSASSFFTAADAPAPATITAPTSGGTVTNTATLTWSAPNQTDYQWRRVKDNAGSADTSTIYYDSGDVVSSTTRSVTVAFDTNNRWEHLQVRVKYNGLWSAWSDIRIQVSYTPPPSPTFTLAPDNTAGSPTQGSILVAITNPAPGAGQPAVSYNEVWITDPGQSEERRATNLAANSTWTYWTAPAGFDGVTVGKVRVVAVATNGTTASS